MKKNQNKYITRSANSFKAQISESRPAPDQVILPQRESLSNDIVNCIGLIPTDY